MAVLTTAMSLRGAPGGDERTVDDSVARRRAIVVHLNNDVIKELQQCYQHGKVVQLLGGTSPRIRYGTKMLDLNVKPETFRHEIYSANQEPAGQASFAALVSHQAHVKTAENRNETNSGAGADAALAALKQSLASMAKEKEARKATISVNQTAKNGKPHSHRQPTSLLHRSTVNSSTSTPRLEAPTSAPVVDAQVKAQEKGMRVALIHLLAVKPLSEQDIAAHTRIPKSQLPQLLSKVADKSGSRWELSTKSFKELDPWAFNYRSEEQRHAAIDNAVRAFDRTRIAKDDKLWQLLLPREERGKGKVLSRLHQGSAGGERRDQGTPFRAPSPIHDSIERSASAAVTPKVGPAGTPRNGASATGRSAAGISIEKRLKEAKKKQDQEKKKQDLEKKKRDKESLASDREMNPRESKPRPMISKRLPPKKTSDKIKSEEIVHDSDDEEGEIVETKPTRKSDTPLSDSYRMPSKPKAASDRRNPDSTYPVKPSSQSSKPPSGDVSSLGPTKREKTVEGASNPRKPVSSSAAASANKFKPTATSNQRPVALHSGSNTSTRERPASPKKTTRPKVPSPLGTSKPRNASEEAEKVPKNSLPAKPPKPSASAIVANRTPQPVKGSAKGEKLTFYGEATGRPGPVIKKRPLEHADDGNEPPRKVSKISNSNSGITAAKPGAPSASKQSVGTKSSARPAHESSLRQQTNAATPDKMAGSKQKNSDGELKRKANDISSGLHDHEVSASKHRKTNSSSTHSLDPTNSSLTSLTTAPTASPDPSSPRSPQQTSPSGGSSDVIQMFLNDAEASPKTQSTWETALDKAAKFRTQLYPAYLELYDRLESMPPEEVDEEDRRTLFMMHSKLKAFKKDIYDAVG